MVLASVPENRSLILFVVERLVWRHQTAPDSSVPDLPPSPPPSPYGHVPAANLSTVPRVQSVPSLCELVSTGQGPSDIFSELQLLSVPHIPATSTVPPPCVCCQRPLGRCANYILEFSEIVYQVLHYGPGRIPNQDGLRLPLTGSSLDPQVWGVFLHNYFDKKPIVDSIMFGWDLGIVGLPNPTDARRNHSSALDHMDDVDQYIAKEQQFGCILGPLPRDVPFKVVCLPLGTVEKTNSDVRRTITDCTFGGRGINVWIPRHVYRDEEWRIRLPTTDSIIAMVENVRLRYPGQRVLGFKMDLSRYYRNWRVDPGQTPFLGIRWRSEVFIDLVYSFGNRAAMLGSQRGSNAICWMFRTKLPPAPGLVNAGFSCECSSDCLCGDNQMVAYVDDLIAICPESLAGFLWNQFLNLIGRLGLQPSSTVGHICPPSAVFTALGVEFDLDNNTVRLPREKLQACIKLLDSWVHRHLATKRELQQLLGYLLHCSRVVRPGRLYVSRMLDTLRRAKELDVAVPLDTNFHLDIEWWRENLKDWNGVGFLVYPDAGDVVALDASLQGWLDGGPGISGFNFINNQWFKCGIPLSLQKLSLGIAELELLGHLLCARVWGHQWRGLRIRGLTDNEACEHFIKNLRSRISIRLSMARAFNTMEHKFH